jgi:hypothetical protein
MQVLTSDVQSLDRAWQQTLLKELLATCLLMHICPGKQSRQWKRYSMPDPGAPVNRLFECIQNLPDSLPHPLESVGLPQ